jgi:hypothetical protein
MYPLRALYRIKEISMNKLTELKRERRKKEYVSMKKNKKEIWN